MRETEERDGGEREKGEGEGELCPPLLIPPPPLSPTPPTPPRHAAHRAQGAWVWVWVGGRGWAWVCMVWVWVWVGGRGCGWAWVWVWVCMVWVWVRVCVCRWLASHPPPPLSAPLPSVPPPFSLRAMAFHLLEHIETEAPIDMPVLLDIHDNVDEMVLGLEVRPI